MEESRPTGCCGGCCKTFCNEFNKRKFSFNYFDPRAFFECQWRIPHLLYILIRFLMFLYSMFGFIIFAIFYPDVMMRYFTIWSYLLLVIHLGLAAFLTLKRYKHWQPPVNVQPTPKAEMNVNTNMNLNTNANSTDLNTERHVDDGTGTVQNRNNRNTSVVVGNRNKLSDTPHKRGVDNQSYELVEITTTNPSSNNSPNINIKNNNNNNNNKSNNNHNNKNNTDDNNVNNNSNNERRHTHAIKWDDTATQHAKESVMNHRLEDSFERSGMQFSDQYGPTNVDEYQFQKSGKVDGTDSIFYRLRLATNRHLSSHLKIRNMSVDDITGFSTALHYKLSWMLYSVTSVTAPVVTIIYFATIYPKNETTGHIGIHDWNIHILNSVFVAIDQLLSARPVRILHGYLSVLFGGCYIVFSVLYWCLDRRNNVVYDILDWNNPELAIGCCIGLVFLFLFIHFLYFVLFRFKLCLAYRAT